MRTVSLSAELWLLLRAVQGLKILADHWLDLPPEAPRAREIPSAISATASLLEARLLMLDRAITGEVDPALVYSNANRAVDGGDEPDVRLREWSTLRCLAEARRAVRRAKARHRHERAHRAEPTRSGGYGGPSATGSP